MSDQAPRDIGRTIHAAAVARLYWQQRGTRARAMRAVAAALESSRADVLSVASGETGLTGEELRAEFERMVRTISMFADLVEEGSWVRAAVDRPVAPPRTPIGPNHDLRSMLMPLGPVVAVFGASNFPLAYGVCGGDTASAWAAGCSVVVKEHPGHPRTGRLLAKLAREAVWSAKVNLDVLCYLEDDGGAGHAVAEALVTHPLVCAVGFTGSIPGGLAIEKLASGRETPIPVYAEMSSVNPVIITRAALEQRGPEIARELAASMLARYGQQCTCPGVYLVDDDGPAGKAFKRELGALVRAAAPRTMLTGRVREEFERRVREVSAVPGVSVLAAAQGGAADTQRPTVFIADAAALRSNDTLIPELFGPAGVLTTAHVLSATPMEIVEHLRGQLTATIYCGPSDQEFPELGELVSQLTGCVGRLIFNGPPTGVRVCTAMVHAGPFPATNRPHTAVGPLAIERWCRRVCYQNAPAEFLPDELKDSNPLGIGRFEDGVWVGGRSTAAAGS
ncbi:MAG TPA: aldehyde dehydrogenase family protein [Phycisphaerales bacterium]|nr:aldehyde dehydrogenase family protein [Phycisphaerales bacterium]